MLPVAAIPDEMRFIRMSSEENITPDELASLMEVATGMLHRPIPDRHAERLLALRLVYSLLGNLRLTAKGRAYLREHR